MKLRRLIASSEAQNHGECRVQLRPSEQEIAASEMGAKAKLHCESLEPRMSAQGQN
jgi:hypothetical protein